MEINQVNRAEREEWADYVKAIAIFLMVACHFNLDSEEGVQFIYMFHMPVFFLLSGYFDKGHPLSIQSFKKCFFSLLVPYFFFSLCNLSICWVSPYLHPELYHHGTVLQSIGKAIVGMFLMEDFVRPYAFMPCLALWFLVALFEIKILFSLVLWLIQKRLKVLLLPLFLLVAIVVNSHVLLFSLDSAGLGLVFYMVGYLLKRISISSYIHGFSAGIIGLVAFVYLYFWGMKNGRVDIDYCVWGHSLILFFINGVVGSIGLMAFAKIMPGNLSFLSEVGRSTLSILGTHTFIGHVGKTLCVLLLGCSTEHFPIWASFTLSGIALVFGVYTQRFLSTHFPLGLGKKKQPFQK